MTVGISQDLLKYGERLLLCLRSISPHSNRGVETSTRIIRTGKTATRLQSLLSSTGETRPRLFEWDRPVSASLHVTARTGACSPPSDSHADLPPAQVQQLSRPQAIPVGEHSPPRPTPAPARACWLTPLSPPAAAASVRLTHPRPPQPSPEAHPAAGQAEPHPQPRLRQLPALRAHVRRRVRGAPNGCRSLRPPPFLPQKSSGGGAAA